MNDQEILEALKKSVAMPPVLHMNERSVIFVDYADGHGEEKVRNRENFCGIDLSTAAFVKRETMILTEDWEEMGNVDLEM